MQGWRAINVVVAANSAFRAQFDELEKGRIAVPIQVQLLGAAL